MTAKRERWRNTLRNKPLMAGLMLGLFLLVLAMANSWALHHAVCTEAASPTHHCAVTLLTSGQVHIASAAINVTTAPVLIVASEQRELQSDAVADFSLPPSRGPPATLT